MKDILSAVGGWLLSVAQAFLVLAVFAVVVSGFVFGVYLATHGHIVWGIVTALGTAAVRAGSVNYFLERR